MAADILCASRRRALPSSPSPRRYHSAETLPPLLPRNTHLEESGLAKAGARAPHRKAIHTQVVPPPPPLPLLLAADVLGTVFGKLGLPPWHARLRFSVHSMVQVLPHNK